MTPADVVRDAQAHTRRLLAMTPDEAFAAAVERNREHLLAAPMLEPLLADIARFGPGFVDDFLREAADGWLAEGLTPTIVRARILGVRQAIRKATA